MISQSPRALGNHPKIEPFWMQFAYKLFLQLHPQGCNFRPKKKNYREFFCIFYSDFLNKIEGDFNLKGFLDKMERYVEFWSDSFLKDFLL